MIKILISREDLEKVVNYGIMTMLSLLGFATLRTANVIYDNRTELMNMASFWAIRHMLVCSPMSTSALLLFYLLGSLIAPASILVTSPIPSG